MPPRPSVSHLFSRVLCLRRFVQYNGGVGKDQLLWLENELSEATAAGQRVIAFGHVPIHPIEAPSNCLVWNYKDVRVVPYRLSKH